MTETDKIILINEGAGFLARVWKQTHAPVTYRRSVYVNGEWVSVTVEYDQMRQGESPRRRVEDKKDGV